MGNKNWSRALKIARIFRKANADTDLEKQEEELKALFDDDFYKNLESEDFYAVCEYVVEYFHNLIVEEMHRRLEKLKKEQEQNQ